MWMLGMECYGKSYNCDCCQHLMHAKRLHTLAHYCYYCGSTMDSNTRMNLISQRVFTYPLDAMQTYCKLPYLLESGSAQLCDKPLCATLTPSPFELGYTHPGNFTILGCAELILRPSMISRIPLEAYTSDTQEPMCIEIEHAGVGKKLKFLVCFCNANWCNTGDIQSMSTRQTSTATRFTAAPRFTDGFPNYDSDLEGSGDGFDTEKDTKDFQAMLSTFTTPAPPTSTLKPFFIKKQTFPEDRYSAWPYMVKTTMTPKTVKGHQLYWNDESKVTKAKAEKQPATISETRRQQTRDVNSAGVQNVQFLWVLLVVVTAGLICQVRCM